MLHFIFSILLVSANLIKVGHELIRSFLQQVSRISGVIFTFAKFISNLRRLVALKKPLLELGQRVRESKNRLLKEKGLHLNNSFHFTP